MGYDANIVPTMRELGSGSLEPTTKTFKGYVGMVRCAPVYVLASIFTFGIASTVGWAPMGPLQIFAQSILTGGLMAWIGLLAVRRERRPSLDQIRRLAHLVRLDPSLASKVNALGDRDYTFARIRRFILENSARSNQIEMDAALTELEDAVASRPPG